MTEVYEKIHAACTGLIETIKNFCDSIGVEYDQASTESDHDKYYRGVNGDTSLLLPDGTVRASKGKNSNFHFARFEIDKKRFQLTVCNTTTNYIFHLTSFDAKINNWIKANVENFEYFSPMKKLTGTRFFPVGSDLKNFDIADVSLFRDIEKIVKA